MNELTDLGSRIRKLRKSSGFTLVSLAKASGISRSYLNEIELGKPASLETLAAICSALGITLAEFFGPVVESTEPVSNELHQVIREARELTPEQLAALKKLIRSMKR
ncbi:MAG: XRE family transcriptional regulator [Desulforudis sp.]|nr:MAG: XRE family transcriptional regulator [Desulforudis sp.]